MKRFFYPILIALLSITMVSGPAFAANANMTKSGKKALVVGKAAFFGWSGGLVVGVASQAFKKSTRNVFMFGSIGMYIGIGLGIYLITAPRGSTPYEGPDTYEEDFSSINTNKTFSTLSPQEVEILQQKSAQDLSVPLYTLKF
jgi:hypothetical protein